MALNETEGLVIGDVLKSEEAMRRSRANLTVLSGGSVALGEACRQNSAGKVVPLADVAAVDEAQTITPTVGSDVDEVQTIVPSVGSNADAVQVITVGGTHSGGTIRFGVRDSGDPDGAIAWGIACAWNATEATMTATIQAALDTICGANGIVLTEIPNTAACVFTFTFSGTGYTNKVQGEVEVDASAMTGATTVSVATTTPGAGTITAGSYRLGITDVDGNVQWTPIIAWNANAAAIITALDDAMGAALVVATGGPMSTPANVVLTYSGVAYTHVPQSLVQFDIDELVGCDDLSIVRTTPGSGVIRPDGNYRIGIVDASGDIDWTGPIAADAAAGAINTALDAALGASLVVATGGPFSTPTAIVLTFSGTGMTGEPQSPAIFDLSNIEGCEDLKIVETTAGVALADGGTLADCVALEAVDASLADVVGVFLTRDAVVDYTNLSVAAGATKSNITAALKAYGIIARTEPAQQETL